MRDANNMSKGCAFVKMTNRDDAMQAIANLHDIYQDEVRFLAVSFDPVECSVGRALRKSLWSSLPTPNKTNFASQ